MNRKIFWGHGGARDIVVALPSMNNLHESWPPPGQGKMCRTKSIIFAGNAWGDDGVNFARDWRKMFSNCGPGPGHMAGTVFRTK